MSTTKNGTCAAGRPGCHYGECQHFTGKHARRNHESDGPPGKYPEKDTPEIEHYARVAGYGLISGQGTSYGTMIIRLKDWSERKGKEHSSDAVVSRLNGQFHGIKEAQIFSFQPAMIPGYGMGNSLELNLQDMTGGELATFYEAAIQFLGALNERPEVAMA